MASFHQVCPPKSCTRLSPPPIRATCPAHLILFYFITRTILGEQYRSLSSTLCSFLHSPVTSSFLGSNILLSTLFSNTLSLHSSLHVSDQVSHPYETTSKIIVLCILILKFLDSKLEDKRFCKHSLTSNTCPTLTSIRLNQRFSKFFVHGTFFQTEIITKHNSCFSVGNTG